MLALAGCGAPGAAGSRAERAAAEDAVRAAAPTGAPAPRPAPAAHDGSTGMDHAAHQSASTNDSAFTALQRRGQAAMGVDQYTSAHQFEPLADGGRIVLQRDAADSAGTATIRAHLREIAARFAAGDFAVPMFVHSQEVPGTRTMAARRATIRYDFAERPGGGEVRITTRDSAAIAAVHEFLAFQRGDHRVGEAR